jgi:hypothetical protein
LVISSADGDNRNALSPATPIGPYIADFACVLLKIVVEVDGVTHCSAEEQAYDARRDAYMRLRGWRILRFTNVEVYKHLGGVLDVITRHAPPSVSPLASDRRDTSPVNGGGKRHCIKSESPPAG